MQVTTVAAMSQSATTEVAKSKRVSGCGKSELGRAQRRE
jgi:hypothetical protein